MDITDLSWRLTGQNVSCPQVLISARFVDSQTQQTTLADLRESQSKHVLFPNIVAQLTAAERQELMQSIVDTLLVIYQRRIG